MKYLAILLLSSCTVTHVYYQKSDISITKGRFEVVPIGPKTLMYNDTIIHGAYLLYRQRDKQ